MKIWSLIGFCSLSLLVSCKKDATGFLDTSCPEQNLVQINSVTEFKDHYIIQLQPDAELQKVMQQLPEMERKQVLKSKIEQLLLSIPAGNNILIEQLFTNIFQGFSATLSPLEQQQLANQPWIKLIEPVKLAKAVANCESGSIPIDNKQIIPYGTIKVGSGDGTGKRAWVLDSGVDTDHPDLVVNTTLSRNFINNMLLSPVNTNAEDDNGHGTHVSGIIAAKNNGFGTLGVAAGAEIVPIKVLGADGTGSSTSILMGLDYVLGVAAAGDVVNMSLGSEPSSLIDLSVENLGQKGIFVTIAAGNESDDANNYSPARANGTNLFTVSAIDVNNRFSPYSNFNNPPVDYAEPGSSVLSTYLDGQYRYLSGTSMSAPHMAGIVLLQGLNFATEGTATADPDGNADKIAVLR